MDGQDTSIQHRCRRIVAGRASGELLVSDDEICFYLVNPDDGVVIEKGHDLEGRSVAGKVLVFPNGKGSSVVQLDGLYQLGAKGNLPAAMIVENLDTVLVACAVILEIPTVTAVDVHFLEVTEGGSRVEVDADRGLVTIGGLVADS
jgi:predicted aconitase with swiveling domain